jgi:hypothetical protein
MVRRFVGAVAAAGALAVAAVAPANAELEFCLVDPPVVVDGTALQVGLYTPDADLAHGGVSGPIDIMIVGRDSAAISTDAAAWSATNRANVSIVATGQRLPPGATETVDFSAFVGATKPNESYSLKIQLPDGSVKTASGAANTVVHVQVDVPVQH